MKCAYCLEEMNEGASVCKTCGREQPASLKQKVAKRNKWILVGLGLVIGVPLVIVTAQGLQEIIVRATEIHRIVQCAHSHGEMTVSNTLIDFEIDQASQGRGWRTGAGVVARQHGCAPNVPDN